MTNYEVPTHSWIIIGSSPCLMFEALYLAYSGNKVTIIEKQPAVGGAWAVTKLGDWSDVDLGPHSMPLDIRGLDFFDRVKTPYYHDKDSDIIVLKRTVLGIKKIRSKYKLVAGSVNNSDGLSKLKLTLRFILATIIEGLSRLSGNAHKKDVQNVFPKYGLGQFLSKIVALLEDANVNIVLNEEVTSVNFDLFTSKVSINLGSGGSLSFDKILFSSFTDINNIAANNIPQAIPDYTPSVQTQLQLALKDEMSPMQGGRCKFYKDDPTLHVIKDLTLYLPKSTSYKPSNRVLVIFIKNGVPTDDNGVDQVITKLKSNQIISENAELCDWNWVFTDRKLRNHKDWMNLENTVGNLFSFLITHPFGHSINENAERWLKVYPNNYK